MLLVALAMPSELTLPCITKHESAVEKLSLSVTELQ